MPKARDPKPKKSRAKGRTAAEQFAEAQRRIEEARKAGATELDLGDLSKLAELPPEIAGLAVLKSLSLGGTQINDLHPLAGLTTLHSLSLSHTQVTDLAPIAGLAALQSLAMLATPVSNLAPIIGLTRLQEVWLTATQVNDITPIADLTALQYLGLSSTPINDLAPLAGLTTLHYLNLMDTQVRDLAPLAGLAALQDLYLAGTQVSDLAPLAGLTALQCLYLAGTQVSDLAPLYGMTKMLDASTSTNAIRHRPATGLDYAATPVAQTSPFDRLVQLEEPARTVETINEVRRRRGLPEHIPEGYQRPDAERPPSVDPVPGVPSAFGFELSSGKIRLAASSADRPAFPFSTSERDHAHRLDACRTLSGDLSDALSAKKYNARSDYAETLGKYAQRLPQRPGDGNILLADAAARTLRDMFAAEVDVLPIGLAAGLKTLLEQHIGLRVYYPEIEQFYRDVQTGHIEAPLPLDAVREVVRGVRTHTPEVFDEGVGTAIAGSARPRRRRLDRTPLSTSRLTPASRVRRPIL
jgi:Leucine-rich repeat (LRR) protein